VLHHSHIPAHCSLFDIWIQSWYFLIIQIDECPLYRSLLWATLFVECMTTNYEHLL
jgi:hypothetical protein